MGIVGRWRRRRREAPPRLDWVQLEVTTRCTASCSYCPRAAAGSGWPQRDLSLELVEALVPSLRRTPYVHLQGWGEPLLHPHFLEIAARVRTAGCGVGTTTNGMLIDRSWATELVSAGLEVVALSLAGVRAAHNDLARAGTSHQQVVAAAQHLRAARGEHERPRIHLAFMLLASDLDDLERLPELVATAGCDEVVVSSLALVTGAQQAKEAELACDAEQLAELRKRLQEVSREASRSGAELYWQLLAPQAAPQPCAENPQRSVFISADGSVHPCVMTGLPVEAQEAMDWDGNRFSCPVTFGTVATASLGEIWRSTASRSFRHREGSSTPPESCRSCRKRYRLPLDPAEHGVVEDLLERL